MKQSLTDLDLESARLYALVLLSQGIEVVIEKGENGFDLEMDKKLQDRALDILELFYWENLSTRAGMKEPKVPGKIFGPFGVVLLIVVIHWAADFYEIKQELILDYGSSALYILQGEFYRVATALFLHADVEHLLGNVVGIMAFGVPVCTLAGTLPGLLMILFTGIAGNFVTALVWRTAHLSIGLSTSVMGAAGILVAFQAIKQIREARGFNPRIYLPLGAGIALVGMLSGGENTDIMAHLAGFASGIVLGALVSVFRQM